MNKKKKWLSLLLSLALLFSLCPQTVSAEEISDNGRTEETCPFEVTGGTYGTDYEWDDTTKKLTITSGLTISMKDGVTTPVTAQIIANKTGSPGNYTWTSLNLTLAGVNITAPASLQAPLFTGGQLSITLADGTTNTLTGGAVSSEADNSCGIYSGGALTISGSGTLNATGGAINISDSSSHLSCGIECFGTISINGGTVIATGGLARVVAEATDAFDHVDPQLTIKGICEIYRRLA